MNIREVTDKKAWESFFNANEPISFLQSWEWGEFRKKMGQDILRLGIYRGSKLVSIALVEKINSKRGKFLFIPHGPVGSIQDQLFNYLVNVAKKEGYSFIRIASILENTWAHQKLFKDMDFKKAPIYLHSENFWILLLEKSEEELLAGMRKTTRYLIRRAMRDAVVIEKTTDKVALKKFLGIYRETVRRERFSPYSDHYIEKEFEAFHKEKNALFLLGKYRGKTLAAALILFTKTGAFYHQGASIHTGMPVPYLLQWEAIKEAKKRECRFYNFWGILIPGRTPKVWSGLTTFKTGFGGYEYKCLPTQDYIISPKYYATFLYETYLQWKRGV